MRIVAYLGHLPNTGTLREGIDQAYQEVATSGTRHLLADEFDAAVADFDRVLAVTPSDAGVLYQRACALASLGRSREALDSLSAAISVNSNLRSRVRRDPPLAVLREDRDVGPLYAKLVPNGLVKRLFG